MIAHRDKVSVPSLLGDARSDYSASKENRFRRRRSGLPLSGGGADYHYRNDADYLRMLEYARDMDRNDMLIGQMIDRAVSNEIQKGFRLEPKTPDKDLNDYILQKRWNPFANEPEACDIQGENAFCDMEYFVSRACKADGDILAIPTHIEDGGQIRLVEAHRVRTPTNARRSQLHQNVIHGVRLESGTRKRTEYWVSKEDVDPARTISRIGDFRQYLTRDSEGKRQVCHVYQSKRVSQTRGITALAPVFDLIGMVDDVNFAKLIQQQVVACFAIIRKRTEAYAVGGGSTADNQRGATRRDDLGNGQSRVLTGISPGMEVNGEIGEDIEGFSPNVASSEFVDHMKLMIGFIAANLGMPLGLALLDPTQANQSSQRNAIEEARRGFTLNQQRLITKFHSPIYKIKLRQWIAVDDEIRRGYETYGDALFDHKWHPPRWPYIEPLKDAKTEETLLARNLASRTGIANGRGTDAESLDNEIVRDNARLIRKSKLAAQSINDEFPDDGFPVTWKDVLNPQGQAGPLVDPEYQAAQSDNEGAQNGF